MVAILLQSDVFIDGGGSGIMGIGLHDRFVWVATHDAPIRHPDAQLGEHLVPSSIGTNDQCGTVDRLRHGEEPTVRVRTQCRWISTRPHPIGGAYRYPGRPRVRDSGVKREGIWCACGTVAMRFTITQKCMTFHI